MRVHTIPHKKIGIITSGGDCAGLNAVIRAITYRATHGYGWEVVGLPNGGQVLMDPEPRVIPLDDSLMGFGEYLLRMGGTVLGTTNRGNPFCFPMPDGTLKNRTAEYIRGYHTLGLDALICIGGDGSMDIMRRLAQQGNLNLVGIPKTIDNDLGCTENAVGYLTAVDVAVNALDQLQPTAASHDRIMVLEVMGRDAGHIALSAGIAGGADIILIPEIHYSFENLTQKIQAVQAKGRNFSLVVVAEAAKTPEGDTLTIVDPLTGKKRLGGIGQYVAENLQRCTGADTRVTVLGHVQRGAQPNSRDRLFGSAFGVHAVDLVAQGQFDRLVAWQNRHVVDVPLADAIAQYSAVELKGTLVRTARGLGICFGDGV